MCNAWNHPPSCTCGWGGVGHLGRRGLGSCSSHSTGSAYWWVPPITQTYESYVNPNACCPECGSSVFFYQSPNGGKVFFDELGPPWPKHPCTDITSIPKEVVNRALGSKAQESGKYGWQENGWMPFFIKLVSRIDKYYLQITGMLGEDEITLYIKSVVNCYGQVDFISCESIGHVRNIDNIMHEISLVAPSGDTTTIRAFNLLSEARKGPDTKRKPEPHKTSVEYRKYISKPNIQMRKKVTSKKPSGPGNNALALALAEARKKIE